MKRSKWQDGEYVMWLFGMAIGIGMGLGAGGILTMILFKLGILAA